VALNLTNLSQEYFSLRDEHLGDRYCFGHIHRSLAGIWYTFLTRLGGILGLAPLSIGGAAIGNDIAGKFNVKYQDFTKSSRISLPI
jgi:hypothetical protein